MRNAIKVLALALAMPLLGASCTKEQQVMVKDGMAILDKACVLLKHVSTNGTIQTICAYEDELNALVPIILAGRAKPAASASASAVGAPVAPPACMSACSAYCESKK